MIGVTSMVRGTTLVGLGVNNIIIKKFLEYAFNHSGYTF